MGLKKNEKTDVKYIPLTHRGPFVWVAPKGHFEYCHIDPDDNFLAIVHGNKKLLLFPPNAFHDLYPHPLGSLGYTIHSQIDLINGPECVDLKQFPLFENAMQCMYECEITDGEVLYIPFGYWHQVTSQEITVSVNFFCGDLEKGHFVSKLLESPRWEVLSYWLLNLIEQNRSFSSNHPLSKSSLVFRHLSRYTDDQLIDCISYFLINRYHEAPTNKADCMKFVHLLRDYCDQKDRQEMEISKLAITFDDKPATKAPRIKIRGLKWRINND